MAYTAPSTHPNSYIVTSTDWAIQVNNDKFFHGPPTVRVVKSVLTAIPNNAYTAISFSSKDWDTNSMFATTGTKVTCKTAGKFLTILQYTFAASTAGVNRIVGIRKNSTGTGAGLEGETRVSPSKSGANLAVNISAIVALTTGQFIEGVVFQDSGGTLNNSTLAQSRSKLSMLWVSS